MSTVTRADPAPSVRARPDTDRRLRIAILVLTVIGLGIAAYTTYLHYAGFSALLCIGGHHGHSSCETVQSSSWSKLDGIPVAVLGLIGYFTILVSLAVPGDLGRLGGFGVALIGFLFSMYLTYREAFSIHAYCEWCLTSAGVMTVLAILTGWRVIRAELSRGSELSSGSELAPRN